MSKYRTGVGLLVADEPDDDTRAVADRFGQAARDGPAARAVFR
jgi:hypothetical protein